MFVTSTARTRITKVIADRDRLLGSGTFLVR
jgi:hypothetical protein